jgi:hypothetical protein
MRREPWQVAVGGLVTGSAVMGGLVALLDYVGPGQRTISINVEVPHGIVVTILPSRTAP